MFHSKEGFNQQSFSFFIPLPYGPTFFNKNVVLYIESKTSSCPISRAGNYPFARFCSAIECDSVASLPKISNF